MIFPIERISDNQIHHRNKSVSYFYELEGVDLEQMDSVQIGAMSESMNIALSNISDRDFVKIFYISKKVYLNTSFKARDFLGLNLIPSNNPFEVFFGGFELYSDIVIGDDYLKINGRYLRLLTLTDFPSVGHYGDLSFFGDYYLFLKKQDVTKSKIKLERLRRLHLPAFSGAMAKHEGQQAYSEIDGLLRTVNLGEECLIDLICILPMQADTLEGLNDATDKLARELKSKGYDFILESSGLRQIYYNCLFGVDPFENRRFFPKRLHETPSSFAQTLIPIQKDRLYDSGYEFFSRSGESLCFEVFAPGVDNFNVAVSGSTGKGKSFIVNKIIFEEVKRGRKAIILDKGKSFYKNVRFNGGRLFDGQINPLEFKDPKFLKEFIVAFLPGEDFGVKEQGHLYYFLQNTDLESFECFMELISALSEKVGDLTPYFEEVRDCFSKESSNLSNITYVELENFPLKFRSGLIIFLIEYFKRLEGKKIFVFDECWDLLRSNSEYIEECFRTFRKLDASAIAITQSVDDLNHFGELGPVILNNSHHKFLLEQILKLKAPFDEFDVGEVKRIQTKKGLYSESYYKSNQIRKPIRYIPTPLEYTLFNTEKTETDNFYAFVRRNIEFFDFSECAKKWTRLRDA